MIPFYDIYHLVANPVEKEINRIRHGIRSTATTVEKDAVRIFNDDIKPAVLVMEKDAGKVKDFVYDEGKGFVGGVNTIGNDLVGVAGGVTGGLESIGKNLPLFFGLAIGLFIITRK